MPRCKANCTRGILCGTMRGCRRGNGFTRCPAAQVTEYPVVDLPAGLYAVAPCLNADLDGAADWERTREEILRWVAASERFAPYANGEGKAEKYPMFHIVSPGRLMAAGISVEDLYVPIVEKS